MSYFNFFIFISNPTIITAIANPVQPASVILVIFKLINNSISGAMK